MSSNKPSGLFHPTFSPNDQNDYLQEAYGKDYGVKDCPICSKKFIPAPSHIYKDPKTQRKVCSYSCAVKAKQWDSAQYSTVR